MIRETILAVALVLMITGCSGQIKDNENKVQSDSREPSADIRVNKEYDENGNLIRYDSSYSYYYSNIENDTVLGDSILNNFRNYFNDFYPFSGEAFFDNYFFQDSLLHYDFYKNDFFTNRFRNNMEYMDSLFMKMDSLKNSFFFDQFSIPESDHSITNKPKK